ncbi:hypothetical protein TELCIR_12609 [Teladorsagia circumcincta]|uniref:Uncharacterized protein n=1 Tax=Teladorsagia circumcincta TaxID=45464 RepID=A0A2G9U651_TELCI|nr:hypothetical protein TELCIR_12609 [Teladorsagia circumcincta]
MEEGGGAVANGARFGEQILGRASSRPNKPSILSGSNLVERLQLQLSEKGGKMSGEDAKTAPKLVSKDEKKEEHREEEREEDIIEFSTFLDLET